MAEPLVEGWTWLYNARKWHYFREGQSLCRRWALLAPAQMEAGNDDSPDNCAACRKARMRERVMEVDRG